MKQKVFTLLTLLLVGISGAWGARTETNGYAGSPYLNIANYADIGTTSGTDFNSGVYTLYNYSTSGSNGILVLNAYGSYKSTDKQKWITYASASNQNATWSATGIFKGSDYYFKKSGESDKTANATKVKSSRSVSFQVTNCTEVHALVKSVNTNYTIVMTAYELDEELNPKSGNAGQDEDNSNTITTLSITGLDKDKKYRITVNGKTNNDSYFYEIAFYTPTCTSVAAPTSLACSAHTKNSLTFGWTAAEHASKYTATLYSNSECTGDPVATTSNIATTSVTFSGLSGSTTYYCKVQSNGDGSTYCAEGNVTDAVSGTTDAKDYTVTANSNNALWGSAAAAAGSLDEGETTEVTATPESGYKFVSWAVSGEGASLSSTTTNPTTLTMGTANATVTATFRALYTYTITYDKGANGTGSIDAGEKTEDVAFTLSSSKFTRAGYVQTGWSLTDGGEKAYDLGGSYTTNAAQTFYPFWTELDAQTNISGATTWDWSTVTNGSNVDLTGTEILNTDVLLSNISKYGAAAITTSGEFDQTGLIINGQYAYRLEGENRFFQGTFMKFNTTIPGNVTVTYANTGNNDPRTVNVNGNKGSKSSNKNTTYQTETFAVSTGTVIIKGVQVSDDENKMLRIKSVIFTPLPEPSNPTVEGTTVTLATTANMDGWRSYNNNTSKKYTVSANTKVYYAAATGENKVTLEEIAGGVPANTAVILHKTDAAGAAAEIVLTETDDEIAAPVSNELKVSTAGQNLGKVYRLGYKSSDGVGFYTYTTTSAPAGIIYVSSVSGANFLSLDFGEGEGDVTSISEIEKMRNGENEAFFNLAGQRVAQPTKGLYIVNGKKVVLK